jgi:signal transduction histidine kinase/CheY-like chemotaxis protein
MEEKVRLRTEELVSQKEKAEKLMEKAEFEREEAKYQRRRAEQSERFKQQFLANMSHEIRTPMNAIMGMTNLILEKDPKKEHISYLNTIRLSSESLLVIINDILDLSKIEAGKMELEQVNFNLEEVVNLIEKTLSYRADEKGLVLSVSYDDEIPDVLVGDAVRLQQVLINIAGNALKFTEKGGVSISVNLEGGIIHGDHAKVRFEIRDTGIGMTRDQQNRVFENFSQASSDTTRKYGGTGLGLSISSKLIDLFGSSIKLESEMGEGSTFHFVINFKISEDQKVVRQDMSISAEMMKELEGISILIAEDNEYNRIVVTETLELKIPGVKLQCAINGEEAVKMAEENAAEIDIVLMDVQMPVMDGFGATRAIRNSKNKKVNTLPVIALTASVIKSDIQKCYDAGMNGYIPKPFKTSELIQSIYQCFKKEEDNGDFKKYIQEPELGNKQQKVTHLSFLQEFTEGDKVRMKKYVEMYLDSARSNVPKLKGYLENAQYEQLRTLVHSMKPHFDFMGMQYGRELAEKIEEMLTREKTDRNLSNNLDKLMGIIDQSISELKESLLSMERIEQ